MKMKFGIKAISISVVILTAVAFSVGQEGRFIGGVGITIFKDRNFRGDSATYQYDMADLSRTNFNDKVSSVRIGPGEQWEVCEHADYKGRCAVVSGEESDLGRTGWDNKISSFRRVGGGGFPGPGTSNDYIVLFTQTNYRGSPTNYNSPTPNLYGMNNRAQSITVGRGTWQVCDRPNYEGRCVTLTRSSANLGSQGMLRRIQSVRPLGSGPIIPPAPNPYIVIFTQRNFRGSPTNYNRQYNSISKAAGSITIGAGVWEICTGYNFTGRCETLSQSVSDLRTLNINRVRSVRPMRPQPR